MRRRLEIVFLTVIVVITAALAAPPDAAVWTALRGRPRLRQTRVRKHLGAVGACSSVAEELIGVGNDWKNGAKLKQAGMGLRLVNELLCSNTALVEKTGSAGERGVFASTSNGIIL